MSSRPFVRPGNSAVYWVTSIGTQAAPTVAEITGGTLLPVVAMSGWAVITDTVEAPTGDSPFTPSVDDAEHVDGTPALVFYDLETDDNTLRTKLGQDAAGYAVLCTYGVPVASDLVQVWPVVSMGPVEDWDVGFAAATWGAEFTVTAAPTLAATVAA